MFFKKLFNKDYRFYVGKGEKFLEEERFADARNAFYEAMQRLASCPDDAGSAEAYVRNKLTETGNRLGLINLAEAEHALSRRDFAKAREHLNLVNELAEDVTIREKAENLMGSAAPADVSSSPKEMNHNCISCVSSPDKAAEAGNVKDGQLTAEDRFELLIQTLPDLLPGRYAALGKKFAYGYLLTHEGEEDAGLKVFTELLSEGENDILLYEIASINYRSGRLADCERLLRRAIELNGENALCYLGLVQLLIDAGRFSETIPLLNHMIDMGLLMEQAVVLRGDVYLLSGADDMAIESYSIALAIPKVARAAAEKLIPLMERQGRSEEAAYLFKQFLKGCC
ncbi:MAG: hypothetical protein FD174_2822 [Geobacteraceae bacterium]|nr:MAG: hypothetical protein FD174_2822 [Geobacteraceae bacterium]